MSKYELIVNYAKCTGCRLCETSCAIGHTGEANPVKSRVRIVKVEGEADIICIPVKCMSCENPPCQAVCPTQAISTHPETGSKIVDKDRCIGCNSCAFACPFGAIVVDRSVGTSIVCDQCDGDPLCARFCPWEAIVYARSEDLGMKLKRDRASRLIDLLQSPISLS
ncbi:MAG: 4Fe-4S dicluster domain-containing protein [Deltaproteobacteria bacterium]|nr:4Fe-4S dicluster domain-containing protein [Deltaproteobacteria bacterium]